MLSYHTMQGRSLPLVPPPRCSPWAGAGPAPSLRGASGPMQLFRVLRLLWMLRALLGSAGEEARWGRAAETVLMSQGRVCVPVRGDPEVYGAREGVPQSSLCKQN